MSKPKLVNALVGELNASIDVAHTAYNLGENREGAQALERARQIAGNLVGFDQPRTSAAGSQVPHRRRKQGQRVSLDTRKQQIVDFLRESGGPANTREIANAIGTTPTNVQGIIKSMGKVKAVSRAHGRVPAQYALKG